MSEIRVNKWFHQSGSGGIYQDSSGNFGIGITNPSSKLEISNGYIDVGMISEQMVVGTATSATIDFSSGDGNIGYIDAPSGPISLYVKNIPTTNFNSKSISFTVVIRQGTTGYACSSVYFNGTSKTIRWSGGSVGSGSTSAIDYFSFVGIDTIGDGAIASYTLMGVKNGNYTLY